MMNNSNFSNIFNAFLDKQDLLDNPIKIAKATLGTRNYYAQELTLDKVIVALGSLALVETNIEFISPHDLNILIKAKELINPPTDTAWLYEQIRSKAFDAFAIAYTQNFEGDTQKKSIKPICFGCIQCKSHIYEYTKDNLKKSWEAMKSNFWTIGFILDDTMLTEPIYKNMVNGNAESEFKHNGWHGMYIIENYKSKDRIYKIDTEFKIIKKHTFKAYETWVKERAKLSTTWSANRPVHT